MRTSAQFVDRVPLAPSRPAPSHSEFITPQSPHCPQQERTQPLPNAHTALGMLSGQPVFPAPATSQPGSPIIAHTHENFSYLHLLINMLMEPPEHLPYAKAVRGIGHRLFTLFSREGLGRARHRE